MNKERDFKGVWIPKEIWLDERLSPLEKVLLVEIDSLDNERGCFKSNAKFAEFMQCGVNTITRSVKKLADLGYVTCRMVTHDRGTSRVIKMVKGSSPKWVDASHQNGEQGNTVRGNTEEKEKAKKKSDKFELPYFILPEVWDDFEKMRKSIKKPLTDRARTTIVNKLRKFGEHSANEILDQSIEHCWQTVYQLKDEDKVEKPSENRDLMADYFNS